MCAFELNFFSVSREYHRFSTEHFALLEIGFGSYNLSSVDKLFTKNQTSMLNPDVAEFFRISAGGQQTVIDKLTGKTNTSSMQIMAYDDVDKKYKLRTGLSQIVSINRSKYKNHNQPPSSLDSFLMGWNHVNLGITTDPNTINGYNLIAHRIQNSLSGCITFSPSINILGLGSITPLIRLYLLNSKDNETSRTVAFNGAPLISAPPTTSEGMTYGYQNTISSNVGVYEKPAGNDPKDNVAGKMRLVWDPTTKSWESGTQQVMARMVDSVDAPEIPKMTQSELLSLTREQVYDVNAEDNPIMGKPTKGRAMVMSTENGNPNLFGPNFKGECGDNKKSMVMAVNRTSKVYKEGAMVICSYINGEWVITGGQGEDGTQQRRLSFGRFEYQQYVIPANLYFTSPQEGGRLLPNVWTKKIRDDYYSIRFRDTDPDIFSLNQIAKTMSVSQENPEEYLTSKFIAREFDQNIDNLIDGLNALSFVNNFYCRDSIICHYKPENFEASRGIPKNVLINSNRKYNLQLPNVFNTSTDPIDKNEVPLHWGVLFSDGYQTSQCAKYLSDPNHIIRQIPIYADDPNLKELSASVTTSLPSFDDDQKVLRFTYQIRPILAPFDSLSLVRNTGGWYKLAYNYKGIINNMDLLDQCIDLDPTVTPAYIYPLFIDRDSIIGLEPVNPRKMQFTPLSIEALHMTSILDNPNWVTLRTGIDQLKNSQISTPWGYSPITSLQTYRDNLWVFSSRTQEPTEDLAFTGNKHYITILSYSKAFEGNGIALNNRHASPLGVVNGNTIVPEFNGQRRSSCAAVIAVKSTIKTKSDGLSFAVNQYFGNPKQSIVSPGQGTSVTILPIGGGIGWSTPGTPVAVNSFPQWGDRNRTDSIDSFGTLALHTRVFENWPENQTIFLGPIFTPLHFNAGIDDDGFDYAVSGNIITRTERLNDDNPPVQAQPSSSVDFKIPTASGGLLISAGTTLTRTYPLASYEDWQIDPVRRHKLLSGGGFAYFKNVIAVASIDIDPDFKGAGYQNNDEFSCSDGTTFKVSASNGQIQSISSHSLNHDGTYILKPQKYSDITSLDVQPDGLGAKGTGAKFQLTFKVVRMVGYDPCPKEVSPLTRLTSSSNLGDGVIDSTVTQTLNFHDSDASSFDVFYFFHNDPTMYTISTVPYNNNNAQYIISEVNPA